MKRIIGNVRMSLKLMIAPLIATLFLVLLAAVSYKGLSEQKIVIDDLASVRFKTYQDASQMIHRMAIVHKDVFKILGFAEAGADGAKIHQLSTECLRALDQLKEGVAAAGKAEALRPEIGDLSRSVDAMRLKMAEAVGQSVEMSRSLSEASSRQAASLEETSSSLEEMASMTRQNAANTTEANRLMAEAEEVIRGADTSMADLRGDMHEITSASEQTRKIIKTIDEIAFQTVTNRSSKVVNLLGEVASASQEQSQGVDQLNRAVADMNNVTQQNAAAAEELSSIMSMFRTDAEAGGRAEAPNPSSASGSQYPCSGQSGSKISQRNLPKPKAG